MKKAILLLSLIVAACSSDDNPSTPDTPDTPAVSVQTRLNQGESPLDLYESGIIVDSLYGKKYQGGYIFHFNTSNGSGLLAHDLDNSSAKNWGAASDVTGADASTIGSGRTNTNAIMEHYLEQTTAADFCNNLTVGGHSDWFLPSEMEMKKMIDVLKARPGFYFGASTGYWTSTNDGFNNAKIVRNSTQDVASVPKSASDGSRDIRIRAARTFQP